MCGRSVFLFVCIIIAYPAISQDNNKLIKRDSFELKLAVDDSTFYSESIKSSPLVLPENTIQIYPGETLLLEVELDGDSVKSMTAVKQNLHPEKTVSIMFWQEKEDRKHQMMMLEIKNPFKKDMKYKAFMFLMKHKKWVETSVIPIEAELSAFETWPDIIVTLALNNWKFE